MSVKPAMKSGRTSGSVSTRISRQPGPRNTGGSFLWPTAPQPICSTVAMACCSSAAGLGQAVAVIKQRGSVFLRLQPLLPNRQR